MFSNDDQIKWHGTRIVCARNNEVTSTLTIQSLHEGKWAIDAIPAAEWWEIRR